MKTNYLISLGIALFISNMIVAQQKTIKAFYTGYDSEVEIYGFADVDENYIEFTEVKPDVLKKFNLKTPELVDQAFQITYTVEEIEDEDGELSDTKYTIVKLDRTIIERNEEDDEEDDENW